MMGELHIRVEAQIFEPELPDGLRLVGNIYAATQGNPSQRHVMIPLGWDVPAARFPLPAGRYVVEAVLPSGEVLSHDVEVADDRTATVTLDATDSPHESHSWQYVIGNIEPAALYYSSDVTYAVPRSAGSRSLAFEAAPGPKAVEVTLLPGGPPGVLDFPALDPLRTLPPPVALNTVVGLLGGPGVPVPATYPNLQAPLYRFAEGAVQVPGPAPQRLTVTSGGDAYLVTLPFPWRSPHGDAAVVEMLVNLRQGPTGSPISVAVRDQLLGAGLAYMSTGALDTAALMFADVRDMLFAKVENPLAAAAAGYVLIGTDRAARPQKWDPWLENLRRWFPHLADGSILLGARRLMRGDVDAARSLLLEGYKRGLPAYTLGLSWLVDGLAAFPDDSQCTAALQEVRRVCWQVDMREPFVVLRLGSVPEEPGP
jgi:hypothetical protein